MGSSGVQENLEKVRERIAKAALSAGRDPKDIHLVAVTKNVSVERITEAVEAGAGILGENYAQEAAKKREMLKQPVAWHMIGHLQSKKARFAVDLFDAVETVDRDKIIDELGRHAQQAGKVLTVMIQLNLAGESSKSGAIQEQALSLIERAASWRNLRCRGLMTIPPYHDDPEKARPCFAALRDVRDRLQPHCPEGVVLQDLSMGMSGDFEVAIQEGATHVRIGTAIFGHRDR